MQIHKYVNNQTRGKENSFLVANRAQFFLERWPRLNIILGRHFFRTFSHSTLQQVLFANQKGNLMH